MAEIAELSIQGAGGQKTSLRKSSRMVVLLSLVVCLLVATGTAQNQPVETNVSSGPLTSGAVANLHLMLLQMDQSAQSAAVDIAKLRIEKWKADANSKQQAQANAQSLERNLTGALPTLTAGVRSAPQDLAPTFKLYRNLTALYDVLSGLTESAGAFGPNQDYDSLRQHTDAFDGYRRTLGDYLENLTASKDSELVRLRAQSPQQYATAPPKKIIIDDDVVTPVKKKTAKKKTPSPQSSQ